MALIYSVFPAKIITNRTHVTDPEINVNEINITKISLSVSWTDSLAGPYDANLGIITSGGQAFNNKLNGLSSPSVSWNIPNPQQLVGTFELHIYFGKQSQGGLEHWQIDVTVTESNGGGGGGSQLSSVTINASAKILNTGETSTFVVNAFDQNNIGLPGVDITVFENGVQIIGGLVTSSQDGSAIFSRTFNFPGLFQIYAKGNNTVQSNIVDITVNMPGGGGGNDDFDALYLTVGNTTVEQGQTINFHLQTTLNGQNVAVGGVSLDYSKNGVPVQAPAVTGSDGSLDYNLSTLGSTWAPGSYNIFFFVDTDPPSETRVSNMITIQVVAPGGGGNGGGGTGGIGGQLQDFLNNYWPYLLGAGALLLLIPVGRREKQSRSTSTTRIYLGERRRR